MRATSFVFALVGAGTGLGLAVLGFQASSAAPAHQDTDVSGRDVPAVGRPLQAAPPRVTHTFAPCAHHAHLVKGACVTVEHRTVTVYDAPPPVAAAPAAAAPAPASRQPLSTGSGSSASSGDHGDSAEPEDANEPEDSEHEDVTEHEDDGGEHGDTDEHEDHEDHD